jgi:PPK2 family polyphosphate:nucleotide phosphotransferase
MGKLRLDHHRYRVPCGQAFTLSSIRSHDAQGLDQGDAKKRLKTNLDELQDFQERLYAENEQSLLLVLQAMDTGGKDSTIRRIANDLNPQGCQVSSFKKPSDEELAHDFLWRVHDHAPAKGQIGIFNRSHYEDVLVVRVHELAPPALIEKRYQHINDFERLLHDHGTRIIKIMLYISKEYQLSRLRRRLERADKHWKFNPADLEEREKWDAYMEAYEIMLNRCSTEHAPWYVIPAETRWFRDVVISEILVDEFKRMNPQYPAPDFDPKDYPPQALA